MAKTPINQQAAEASQPQTSPMAQLQEIVFGEAQRSLNSKIDHLSDDLNTQLSEFKQVHQQSIDNLQKSIAESQATILAKLSEANQMHSDKADDIQAFVDKTKSQLRSEIEMTDTSGKDNIDELHNRIDREIRELSQLLNDYKSQTLEKLSAVNNELNSSKTDRKTLAKLLATMATNLEADENQQ